MLVNGVYAAALVPRLPDGELDEDGFRAGLAFLRNKGLGGIVVNGATGEYCLTAVPELDRMLAICAETLPGLRMLCGIGAAGLAGCLQLGRVAVSRGAHALLLPMPHFFPYSQDDLRAFSTAVPPASMRPSCSTTCPASPPRSNWKPCAPSSIRSPILPASRTAAVPSPSSAV